MSLTSAKPVENPARPVAAPSDPSPEALATVTPLPHLETLATASLVGSHEPEQAAAHAQRRKSCLRMRALLWGADLAIAALGAGAGWLAHREGLVSAAIVIMAGLWFAFMTLRQTRDGRVADLTDARRIAKINIPFVLVMTLTVIFFADSNAGVRSIQVTLGIATGMAALAMVARWTLTRPILRRWLGLFLDENVVVVGDLVSVSRTITEWEDLDRIKIIGVCLSESDEWVRTVKGIPVLGTAADVADVTSRIRPDIVAVHDVDGLGGLQLAKLQWALEEVGAQLSVITPVTNTFEARATVRRTGRRLIIDLAHSRPRGTVAAIKGAFDRTIAGLLLLIALPTILICAVLIKVTSPGPVIFRQTRVREQGQTFTMYKLRTMTADAEERLAELLDFNEVGGGLFKIKADPRVTKVGAWLRRLSLDELPQLFNVVVGDMSLVGPRPALPHEVESYDEWARRRLAVKPGLTGLWQVSGRSNLSWDESVRIDSDYVDNWRFGRDLIIGLRTVKAVLTKEGAH